MKTPNLKHSIEVLLILACCLSFSTAQAGPAPAAQTSNVNVVNTPNVNVVNTPTVTMPTHLGVPFANMITLSGGVGQVWSALLPDGSFVDQYAIPTGHELLITDVSWAIGGGTPGDTAGVNFYINIHQVWADLYSFDGDGNAFHSQQFTTPIPFPVLPNAGWSGGNYLSYLFVRGYVVPQ